MKSRHAAVDNLKAIGIVLVVLGHAPALPEALHVLIFGCHVPLFFFAAGFLHDPRRDLPSQAAHIGRRLLLPYAAFFLLSYAYWLATRTMGNAAQRYADLAWWDPLLGFALGHGSYVNPTLWFFPCLATTALLYALASRRLSGRTLLAAAGGVAAIALLLAAGSAPRLPWQLDSAAAAVFFYALGQSCRRWGLIDLAVRPATLRAWAAALFAAYALLALANPGVDLAAMRLGERPALFVPVAVLGIATCCALSLSFHGSRLSRWLSANTLTIFPLHWLMFRVFTGVGIVVFGLPRDFKDHSWLVGLIYVLLALALCWPAAALVRRAFDRRKHHDIEDRPRGAPVPSLDRGHGGRSP
jgi:acyltransferase